MRFLRVALLLGAVLAGSPSTSLAATPSARPAQAASSTAQASSARVTKAPAKPMLAITAKPVGTPAFWPPLPGADRKSIIASGKQLLLRQQTRAQHMLPTTGFHSLEDVAKAVSAMGPTRAAAVDMLKKENSFEFAMRTPGHIRDSIAEKGFLNQHDTKTSRGTLDNNYRANAEAAFLGVTREQYDQLPNSVRPKYGYLQPSRETGLSHQNGASQYGEDTFVFKPSIKNHVTFYPTDSLGYSTASRGYGGTKGAAATEWHHLLQPWSQRMLLAPSLEVTKDKQLLMGAAPPPGFKAQTSSRYLEIQIWRPVTLKDVARFEFTSTPPTGTFLKSLRDSGVKIYRQGSTEEWKDDQHTSLLPRSPNFITALAA